MLNKKPTVSVILPTHNRAKLVGRAIQSVLDQTYQDFEIIIVNDNSKDNTEEIVSSFTDPRIRYVKHHQNKGAGAARNTGIKLARGKYIAFQDSDDEWLPQKLEMQIEVFENASSKIGVIYTDMLRIQKDGKINYWPSPTVTNGNFINPSTLEYQVFGIGIQSILIKSECFNIVGYFDEKLPRYIDLDLLLRLVREYHFYHIKIPLVKYWATEGISTNNNAEAIARKLLLEKHFEYIKKDKNFVARQYSRIGCALQVSGRLAEGKSYIIKALRIRPLDIKYLLIFIISLSGQKTFIAFTKVYQKIFISKTVWK